MKTSNKSLIILAIVLLVVPLSAMIYTVTKKGANIEELYEGLKKEASDPVSQDIYLKTIKLNPFNKVSIVGNSGNNALINISFIKSNVSAVKTQKDQEKTFDFDVDKNGELKIIIQQQGESRFINLFILAPDPDLELSNIKVQNFETNVETLNLTLNNITYFSFIEDLGIQHLNLALKECNLGQDYYGNTHGFNLSGIKYLQVALDQSALTLPYQVYDKVQVSARKSSSLTFKPKDGQPDETGTIEELYVNAEGDNAISFNKTNIHQIEGKVSDSTRLDIPMGLVRKLVK